VKPGKVKQEKIQWRKLKLKQVTFSEKGERGKDKKDRPPKKETKEKFKVPFQGSAEGERRRVAAGKGKRGYPPVVQSRTPPFLVAVPFSVLNVEKKKRDAGEASRSLSSQIFERSQCGHAGEKRVMQG